jgi:hypothetical protein
MLFVWPTKSLMKWTETGTLALSALLYVSIVVALPAVRADQNEQGFSLQLPLGLNPDSFHIPEDNPPTRDKIDLGRLLFFDARLSANDSVACATCHAPEQAFTDGNRVSTGIYGGQALLAGLHEVLGPFVVQTLGDTFSAAQFGNAVFASQPIQYDTYILLRTVLLTRLAFNITNDLLGR